MRYFIKRNNTERRAFTLACVCALLLFLFVAPFAAHAEGKDAQKENVPAALTIRDAFANLQAPSLEILKRTVRLDMLDYLDADSIYKATNAMEGLSWIEGHGTDYLKVRLTPVSTVELKLLPVKKGCVLMTVYTVGGNSQAEDSQIDFYDEQLVRLDTKKYFSAPDLSAFFEIPKGSLTSMKEIRDMIPFPTVAYSCSADSNDLEACLTVGEYMNVDDYNIAKLFLKPSVTLKWNGKYK